MECKQCGSKKELYVFKDCCDCEVLCKSCLMETSFIEEETVKKYINTYSNDVFFNKEDLLDFVIDGPEVEIQSEDTTVYHDFDLDEWIDYYDEDLIIYLEEKYNAVITEAVCPECGAEKDLYLVIDGDERNVMCMDCILEEYEEERDDNLFDRELKWKLEEKLKIQIIEL